MQSFQRARGFGSLRFRRLFLPALPLVTLSAIVSASASSSAPYDASAEVGAPIAAQSASCRAVTSRGGRSPDLVIAVDLPLRGRTRYETLQMAKAVQFMFVRSNWRAGRYSLGLKVCDDATAAKGAWDERRCAANGRAHVTDARVVAIIGTYNSGCTAVQLPITNHALLVTVSPANTYPCLTEHIAGCPASEPFRYQPSGTRTYARVVGHDGLQAEAMVVLARRRGAQRLFFLHDGGFYGRTVALLARNVAAARGLRIAGFKKWPARGPNTSLMAEIRRSRAEAILVFGISRNGGPALVKDKVATLGGNRLLPIYTSDGFVTSDFLEAAGHAGQDVVGFAPSFPPLDLGFRARTLMRGFARWHGIAPTNVQPYTPLALQAAELVLEAIRVSDGSRIGVRNAVFRVRSRGSIIGRFKISPEGDAKPATIGVFTARNGVWRMTSRVRVP